MFSQPSTSQRRTTQSHSTQPSQSQSQYTDATITPTEKEKKISDLVQYMLVMDQKKLPIKKRDINKVVLKESSKAFNILMTEASQRLSNVFGFKVVELADKFKGSYILVNTIENDLEEEHLEWSDLELVKMGLLSVILSMIFMNGNSIEEDDLWNALKVLGINQTENHSTFGNTKAVITEEFTRQGYLDIKTQTGEVPKKEFRWGQRATLEFKKKTALGYVSDIYKCNSEEWLHQYQEVKEELESENESGSYNQPMEIS